MLVIAMPDTLNVQQIIATARMLNPAVGTVVRSYGEEEAHRLEKECGSTVFLGEETLAQAMADHVLACASARGTGATVPGVLHESA